MHEPWISDEAYDEWLRALKDDVIEGEYGYEPGEFDVYANAWWPLYQKGLTPHQAWQRALNAYKACKP